MNVDDAVDDMFRQIRGVTDDISGALKSATTGIRHKFPSSSGELSDGDPPVFTSRSLTPRLPARLTTSYRSDSEYSERLAGASVSEDEFGGNVHGLGSLGWQSDSDVHLYPSDTEVLKPMGQHFVSGKDLIQSRFLGSRLEEAFSDGQSPVESYDSETVADDLGMPHEVFYQCCNNTFVQSFTLFEVFTMQFPSLFHFHHKNRILCLIILGLMKIWCDRCF